jgi:D-glycero-beta-D-manno-heptose 1-phosphate adenylyltransferase
MEMHAGKLDILKRKIFSSPAEMQHILNIWRFTDQKIVFTNGCFDLLHLGHIDYLAKAADLGNKLVVGLNSDSSTSKLKGPTRPITDQASRSTLLAALSFVDAVILFDEPTPIDLISTVLPDILVKGADYSLGQIVGADVVLAKGGEVKTIEFLPGYSTSSIESKIKSS